MTEAELREQIVEAGLRLKAAGLIARTWGNVSARLSNTEFLITPTGIAYEELTPEVGISYLKKLGFEKISSEDYGMAEALGGLTYGVSPLEMAKGYLTIENDGLARNPGCIERIEDTEGNVLYEVNQEETEVYEENAARAMTDMLQSVVTEGTARGIDMGDMPAAGKTGTTNSNRDGWFVGYTSYYTTSVWVGYDIPKKVPGLTGSSYPAAIWEAYMNKIHAGLAPIGFKEPVEYIGTEEQMEEPEDEEDYGEFDEEGLDEEPEETTITQTFEGTEVPDGVIPEGATNVTITTTIEE